MVEVQEPEVDFEDAWKRAEPSSESSQPSHDDFAAAFDRARPNADRTPDYRGDQSKPNVDLVAFLKGIGQSALSTGQSLVSGIPGTLEAVQQTAESLQGGEFNESARGGFNAPRGPAGQLQRDIAPEPLPPAQSGEEATGRFLGGVAPWAAVGAVAPWALVPLAGTTTLADQYQTLTDQGVRPERALAVAGAHASNDMAMFAILPVVAQKIEAATGVPFVKEAVKALATGDIFAANRIVSNAITKGTDTGQVEALTGATGALGQGLLLHALMTVFGRFAAALPKTETRPAGETQRAEIDLTGGGPSFAEQVQAREEPQGTPVHEVRPEGSEVAGATGPGAQVLEKQAAENAEGNAVANRAEISGADVAGAHAGVSAPVEGRGLADSGVQRAEPGVSAATEVEPPRSSVQEPEAAASEPTNKSNEGESTTSIKNAVVERELKAMDLEPPEKDKTNFPEQWQQAKATLDSDPLAGQKLVDDLRENNRPPTKEEGALLALEANRLIVERDAAEQAVTDAPGDPAAPARRAAAEDAYARFAEVMEKAGTESSWSLQIRKMMIARDYSLAAMERKVSVTENAGEPLSDEQRAEVKDLHDRIHETQAKFDAYVKEQEAKRADLESQLATERLKKEVRARAPAKEKPVRDYISKKAEEAKEFYRKGGTMLRGGYSPIGLEDVARISYVAADYIIKGADAATELVKDFGERIKPHLDAILSRAREIVNVDKPLGKIEERLKEGSPLSESRAYVQKIAKHVLAENPELEHEGLTGRVHEILKPVAPDLTHEQTRDLISGYGEYKQVSKEALDVRFRDLKGQMQQVAKLEDMIERLQAPKKTGFEQREPSAEERKLIKEVNETKKKLGIKTTDPETELKSTLDSIKTRLQHEIEDMAPQIESRTPTVAGEKAPAPSDEESRALQAKRDEMKSQLDEIKQAQKVPGPTPDETRARQINAALNATERQIAGLQNPPKPKLGEPKPTSPELDAARERLNALREQRTYLRNLQNPQIDPDVAALQLKKKNLAASTADIKERIAKGDFDKRPPRQSLLLDPEAQRLQAENAAARKEFKDRARQAELAKRTPFEWAADLAVSVMRAFKLTSGSTLGKLASGGASRLVTTPIEEVLGGVIGKIPGYRGIFEQAPREGGLNTDAIAKGYATAWRDTITQGAKKLKTGKWDFETLYGKGGPEAAEWTGFFGRLHGMMKTPEALNEFTLAAEKRERWAAKNMRDPTNPIVQMGIGIDAAKDADRSVFNQDSRVADEVNSVLRKLETPSKTTGRPTVLGKTAATVVREEIPFAKVPSNIVGEALVNAFGLVSGNIKAAEVLRAGVENIDPAEADQIARHLKKGALGAAVLALGYFNHKNVGGFYQPGKRQPDQPDFGTAKVGGMTIPKIAMASPLMLVYQLGGTIGNVAETYLRKRDIEPVGLPMATLAGTLALLQDVPLVGEATDISKAITEPQSREGFVGRRVAGDVIPAGVAWAARLSDTDAQGNEIKRKAVTVGENLKAAIPGARETLPVKR